MSEHYWVRGPSAAARLRDEYEGQFDARHLSGVRWVLARPLLWLWERAAGRGAARNVAVLMRIGHRVLSHLEWADHEGEAHPQSQVAYQEEIQRLRDTNYALGERLREARDAATAGENLARALRRVDGLIDGEWRPTRGGNDE